MDISKNDILHNILNSDDESNESEENYIVGNDEEDIKLFPLLQEIGLISDYTIRHFVRSLLLKSEHFFDTTDDPDKDLVLHTKRVFRLCKLLLENQERGTEDCDVVYAAALIHDITKHIEINSEGDLETDPFHPYTVGPFVMWARKEDSILTVADSSSSILIEIEPLQQILRLIRCHMGSWLPVPETMPITSLEWILHNADYIANNLEYILYADMNDVNG